MIPTVDRALLDRVRRFRSACALTKSGKIKGNEHALDMGDLDALLSLAARLVEPDEDTLWHIRAICFCDSETARAAIASLKGE
jgi:hypothetical protein